MKKLKFFALIVSSLLVVSFSYAGRPDTITSSFGISYSVFYSQYHFPIGKNSLPYFEDLTPLTLIFAYQTKSLRYGIGPSLGENSFGGPHTSAPTGQVFKHRLGFNMLIEYYPFKKLHQAGINPYLFYNFRYKFKKILETYDVGTKETIDYPKTYFLENVIGIGCKMRLARSFYFYSGLGIGVYNILNAYKHNADYVTNLTLTLGYDF